MKKTIVLIITAMLAHAGDLENQAQGVGVGIWTIVKDQKRANKMCREQIKSLPAVSTKKDYKKALSICFESWARAEAKRRKK